MPQMPVKPIQFFKNIRPTQLSGPQNCFILLILGLKRLRNTARKEGNMGQIK